MEKRPRVLCIDDQEGNLHIRTKMLEQFGCDTVAAKDHPSALRIVAEDLVDVLVIDYHLANGRTGEDIARDVRVMRPDLPMIMLSGDVRLPETVADCVDAVLIKGASNPRALLELIEKLVPEAKLRPRREMLIRPSRPKAS